jgi:hypothetical protein
MLPSRANQVLELLSGPKQFVARMDPRAAGAIRKGLIFVGISLVLTLVLASFLMDATLAPGRQESKAALPAELVGAWELKNAASRGGVYSLDIVSYKFFSDGRYFTVGTRGSTEGRCIKSVAQNALGRVSVEGSNLVLIPQKRTEMTQNGCSGEKSEAQMALDKEVYRYEIRQQPSGWTLCLTGRLGERCLIPTKS